MSSTDQNLTLEELEAQFQSWRNQKKYPRERVPEELWQKAVSLIPRYSRAAIIKRLHVNCHGLKSRLEPQGIETSHPLAEQKAIAKEDSSAFVAVALPLSSVCSNQTCERVEVERVDGSRMRLYTSSNQAFDIHSLINTFLDNPHASSDPTK